MIKYNFGFESQKNSQIFFFFLTDLLSDEDRFFLRKIFVNFFHCEDFLKENDLSIVKTLLLFFLRVKDKISF